MNPLVLRSSIVAAVGGLIFGFDTAVISGAQRGIIAHFGITETRYGFVVATALIGTIIGAVIAGRPADRYGRKRVLVWIGFLFLAGSLLTAISPNLWLLMAFRLLGGVGVGMASVLSPIYTAEIAPPSKRGRLVGLVQLSVVIGILTAYLSNVVVLKLVPAIVSGNTDPTTVEWRYMLAAMAIPTLIFLALLPTICETPRWLIGQGRIAEGEAVAQRLTGDEEEAATMVAEVRAQIEQDRALNATKAPFFVRQNRKVILLAIAIAAFNQLSGINAVLYYAPEIFRLAGFDTTASFLQSAGIGLVNLVATVAAVSIIDRVGRRRLMLIGTVGYLVSLGTLAVLFLTVIKNNGAESTGSPGGASYLVLAALALFIASHAFGEGSVIWVFLSEIFPSRIRARGQSLGSLTHWTAAAIITWLFPGVVARIGPAAGFGFFFVCMVGLLFWVILVMPETKGVALEDMDEYLGLEEPKTAGASR